MCHKVIATYQQTFKNLDVNAKSQTFAFNRIYKIKPEQYFRISCVALTSVGQSTKYDLPSTIHCGEMYLTGLPFINKNCNVSALGKNARDELLKFDNNAFYLGNLNSPNGNINSFFRIDEIPLDNFTITNFNFEGEFTACFHIELIEP